MAEQSVSARLSQANALLRVATISMRDAMAATAPVRAYELTNCTLFEIGYTTTVVLWQHQQRIDTYPSLSAAMQVIGGSPRLIANLPARALANPRLDVLSEQDRHILKLVAEGLSNRQIAPLVNMAYATVKNRLSRIYKQLGVNGRADAVAVVLSHAV